MPHHCPPGRGGSGSAVLVVLGVLATAAFARRPCTPPWMRSA